MAEMEAYSTGRDALRSLGVSKLIPIEYHGANPSNPLKSFTPGSFLTKLSERKTP